MTAAAAEAPAMTDEQLGRYLQIPANHVAYMTPEKRAAYEQIALTEMAIKMYLRGEGPRPPGVIICGRTGRKRRCAP